MADRILVIILDGFRRDFLSPELTPTLWALARAGQDFPKARAVFPSATRVNSTAISTGTLPATNGIIANRFCDPRVFSDRAVDTSRLAHLEAMDRAYDGGLLSTVTLGEALAQAGRSMAVITSGSEGTTFLANPRAARNGHVTLSVKDWGSSVPGNLANEALELLGPIPPLTVPNSGRNRYVSDLYLRFTEPRLKPDVTLLWYNDPDKTLHSHGPGTPVCLQALRDVDAELARIVAWRDASPDGQSLQMIVASDHGHVTGTDPIEMGAEFAAAGFPVSESAEEPAGTSLLGIPGYLGTITDPTPGKRLLPELVDWLMTRPWCGCLFTRRGDGIEGGIPGTFAMELLGGEHPRMPDLYYTSRGDDRPNQAGWPGCSFYDGSQPPGGGMHGGLNPRELASLLILNGSRFGTGRVAEHYAGDIDIAPTVLALLGIPRPATMRGRALCEVPDGPVPAESRHSIKVRRGRRVQRLDYVDNGSARYFDGGFVETE
ncbi:alkaline phosphatase family protein [Frigidibacter sp. ROC022]|uniref:alkaline phosphatase family protein n=1 Tax=Frigidibacter sp. ROC022 TaxID=2971796 RepID=UPI00215B65F5|nr:alkaline phosphatase family protein [Frigidibacter sp. ROC022]MCR8723904.1 alkaline phosphatase family protein [Frigidibacter sp. ROC022]